MTQNNEREAFEVMARQRGWSLENSEGEYLCDYTRIGWIAWRERAISTGTVRANYPSSCQLSEFHCQFPECSCGR